MPSRNYITEVLRCFSAGETHKNKEYVCSVQRYPINGGDVVTQLYSYDLLIGQRHEIGEVALIPIPPPGCPNELGGSQTSRALIEAAHKKFPMSIALLIPSCKEFKQ